MTVKSTDVRVPRAIVTRRVLPAAAFLLVLTLGIAIGLLLPQTRTPADASAEAGFARDMATHHAQAVEMSMIAYARTGNPEVATLAMDIALTQQTQIGIMSAWLNDWKLPPTGSRPAMAWMDKQKTKPGMRHGSSPTGTATTMPGMATKDEIKQLRQATGPDLDIKFTDLMIRHHQGGITMVEDVLAAGPRAEVSDLAAQMRAGQEAEIAAMQSLRHRLTTETGPGDSPTD